MCCKKISQISRKFHQLCNKKQFVTLNVLKTYYIACEIYQISYINFIRTLRSCFYNGKVFYSQQNYLDVAWNININGIIPPSYPLQIEIQALANGQCDVAGYCLNGGSCIWANYTYSCSCPAGFSGQQCEYSELLNIRCIFKQFHIYYIYYYCR